MNTTGSPVPPGPPKLHSFSDLLWRLTWFLLGPLALIGLTVANITHGGGWITLLDVSFVLVVGLVILARWMELRAGTAMTATGERATPSDVRRYSQVMAMLAAGVWVASNVFGNHVVT